MRYLRKPVRSSTERVAGTVRRHLGELLQLAGSASALTGVFVLFGLGVGLIVTGLAVVGVGTLHEAGRL